MKRSDFMQLLGFGTISLFSGASSKYSRNKSSAIKPARLREGATIGLISPGFILQESDRYDKIVKIIQKMGFKVKEAEYARNQYGYLAGTDEQRASDLNTMFADPEVDAIIPFRGGWGSNRILELLDYGLIERNPKPLIGFSDITSLLLAIYAQTGLVTFHGPVGKSEWTDFTIRSFRSTLMNSKFLDVNTTSEEIATITPGKTSGQLLGGNLSVLTSMLGSGYLPDFNDAILFLEDVGEDIYRIDRMMTQLQLNGILDKINGFVFGKCTDCDAGSGPGFTLDQILIHHIAPLQIPAFRGAMIGHIDDMVTLPIGIRAEIHSDSGMIKLLETAVK